VPKRLASHRFSCMREGSDDDTADAGHLTFGESLRSHRVRAMLSGRQLAKKSGLSQTKISRIESGKLRPSASDFKCLVDALPLSRGELAHLSHLHSREKSPHGTGEPQAFLHFRNREQRACKVDVSCVGMLPVLLQTIEYSRIALDKSVAAPEPMTMALQARLDRQAELFNRRKQFRFLVTEDVLCRWSDHREPWRRAMGHVSSLLALGIQVREAQACRWLAAAVFEDFVLLDGHAFRDSPGTHSVNRYDVATSRHLQMLFDRLWRAAPIITGSRIDELMRRVDADQQQPPAGEFQRNEPASLRT
jgi:transcriptional regulator with XRE-family HTH domain